MQWALRASFRGKTANTFPSNVTVHRGAFSTNFVRLSILKQNIEIFVNFFDKLGQNQEDFCYYLRIFEIFSFKVWNFSTKTDHFEWKINIFMDSVWLKVIRMKN